MQPLNIFFGRAEIKGTEQIVVDPFDPRKHITVGQLQSQQQNGSSGDQECALAPPHCAE